ncbi:MAG: hypothetical protein Q9227_001773 [Pyrenula ochraceoflavens]
MASQRPSSNLYLLASLLSTAALVPTTSGLFIPNAWRQDSKNRQTDTIPSASSPESSDEIIIEEVDIEVNAIHQDTRPPWAREGGDINRNLHSNGRFIPLRIPAPDAASRQPSPEDLEKIKAHPHFFLDEPMPPTPTALKSLGEDADRLPDPVNSHERPIPTTALMAGISDPDDVPAFLRNKMLEDIAQLAEDQILNSESASSSIPTEIPQMTDAEEWVQIMDLDFPSLQMDSPPTLGDQSSTFYIRYFKGPTAWFERTSVLILGMLVLFLMAVGIVEMGECLLKKCRHARRRRRSRSKGTLRLDGDEKRLSAIVEVDEVE